MANKFEEKLKEYIKSCKDDTIDMEKCAKLKMKASKLTKKSSEKLYSLLNTTKKLDFKKIIKVLNSGADVNFKFKDGITVYMLSALNGHVDALELLKNYGANVNAKNCYGQNALMLVLLMKKVGDLKVDLKYTSVIIKLKAQGVSLEEKDKAGFSVDDYIQGKTEPFTKTYLKNIRSYLKSYDDILENEK